MRLWSWVYPRGSSVGFATNVTNSVIKLQSVGVRVAMAVCCTVQHATPHSTVQNTCALQYNAS